MKIEKLNEQQIRCTLTKEDLAVRHITPSELAYGSEKTRQLFQDMMKQAFVDFGFDVEDIPLMVEAIPMSKEQIVLIITKVESPDELDTRFSEFSNYRDTEEEYGEEDDEGQESGSGLPEDLVEMLREIRNELIETEGCPAVNGENAKQEETVCRFAFENVVDAVPAARAVAGIFSGHSALYREEISGDYNLFLHRGGHSAMEFGRICHTLEAYLEMNRCMPETEACCREHGKVIIADHAVQILAEL